MEELNAERIIEIHDRIIEKYGGANGILYRGTLELLAYKIIREKDIFRQASLILHTISAQHPFFDGNKRTSLAAAENILGEAGYYLDADEDEIVNLMKKIAEYKCSVRAIEKWIREKAKTTSLPIS